MTNEFNVFFLLSFFIWISKFSISFIQQKEKLILASEKSKKNYY